ncbi:MAG: glycogen/starch/alpha-glucan phosphorylase [Candidatus Melainabacteria bacterium]|nr:glycogen/starch/alpha-glucan phosphorylase [Candidatus Melainabacteria bacterium]
MDKPSPSLPAVEDDRTGMSVPTLRRALADNLYYIQGKFPEIANRYDYYMMLAYTVRDRLFERWINTIQTYLQKDVKVVAYLSAEFLLGPHLANAMINMGIHDQLEKALQESGLNMQELLEQEEEPGLGNGGLGRLAACYLDSLATMEIPAIGYGIRYEFGIFDQDIRDGWQVEITDKWLRNGNPWEVVRPMASVEVNLGGYTRRYTDAKGKYKVDWVPERTVIGVPYDTPIPGYNNNTANNLRLWKAESPEMLNLEAFNHGDYVGAVSQKIASETISKILYPNDNSQQGKRLRLEQQYFFVSCSLQDMLRVHKKEGQTVHTFHEKFSVQLNDTHPSIAVAELMRLLVDVHDISWEEAWNITTKTMAYTNHTLLPEALEKWPISLFRDVLPRHLEIIFEINYRFLASVKERFPNDEEMLSRLSIIDESGERYVRMANLASVGSHSINGVAALHTDLLKKHTLADFYKIFPEKFNNKTNGVTPRRWMRLANPAMSKLIDKNIGNTWTKNLDELRNLEKHVDNAEFRQEWRAVKKHNKEQLARWIHNRLELKVDPDSLFDIQVKRIHEYKRQHLSALHIVALYHLIKENPNADVQPRTFIFGGKAAPGYHMAKLIIKLINSIGEVVNSDPLVSKIIKVAYLPDFNVSLGQRVYPAADLSEQISLAGKEASGTGNMKFALNGAVTIGTLDGANIEIREEAGHENFFLFGMTAQEAMDRKAQGYVPLDIYKSNDQLKQVIDSLGSGLFSRGDRGLFKPLVDNLLYDDHFMLLADFASYVDCHKQVGKAYKDKDGWTRKSIYNVARMGKFSSDRSIKEYCQEIWDVHSVPIHLKDYCHHAAQLKVNK